MVENTFAENLKLFGLTGQEAVIYETLLKCGAMTGYEVSKETGISRSNAYGSLAGLVEKGAAFVCEGEATKYVPEDIKVFTENFLKRMEKTAKTVVKQAPGKKEKQEGYITVSSTERIKEKISRMLDSCELRLYIMAEADILEEFREKLAELVKEGKKVVILSDGFKLKGAIIYKTEPEPGQIRFITDSSYVLTGTLGNSENDTCLYSGESNLVSVMKEALKNKITLIENNMEAEE